jgi:filamentous hemagglutinin
MTLQAADPVNSGAISSSGALTLTLADLTNTGTVSGGTGLALVITNGLANSGSLVSGGDMTLQAASLTNTGSSGITAAGALTGQIGSVSNQAPLAAGGAMTLTGLSSLNNYDLMVSDGAMRIGVVTAFNNWGGAVLGGTGLSITGPAGGSAGTILNSGGSLETASGLMTLTADQVINQASGTLRSASTTVYDAYGNQSVPLGPCTVGDGCAGEYWSAWEWVANPSGSDAGAWYGSSSGLTVHSWVVQTGSTMSGTAGSIKAGGDLRIAGTSISNLYSSISSVGDMSLVGGTLTNVGGQLVDNWYVSSSSGTMTRCYGGRVRGSATAAAPR